MKIKTDTFNFTKKRNSQLGHEVGNISRPHSIITTIALVVVSEPIFCELNKKDVKDAEHFPGLSLKQNTSKLLQKCFL